MISETRVTPCGLLKHNNHPYWQCTLAIKNAFMEIPAGKVILLQSNISVVQLQEAASFADTICNSSED